MQKWEVDSIMIGHADPRRNAILNARGAQGWEPYAVDGVTHYFKRMVAGEFKEVEAAHLKMGAGSAHEASLNKREVPDLTDDGYEKVKQGRFKGLQEITKPRPKKK